MLDRAAPERLGSYDLDCDATEMAIGDWRLAIGDWLWLWLWLWSYGYGHGYG